MGWERWRAVSLIAEPPGTSNSNHQLMSPFLTTRAGPVGGNSLTYLQPAHGPEMQVWSSHDNSAEIDPIFGGPVTLHQAVCPCSGGGSPPQSIFVNRDGEEMNEEMNKEVRDEEHPAFTPDPNDPIEEQVEQMREHLGRYPHHVEYVEDVIDGRHVRVPYLPQLYSAEGHKHGRQQK